MGSGQIANDGSNNFAAEVAGIFAALIFAVENGYRAVCVHTDFATMHKHLSGRVTGQTKGSGRSMILKLKAYLQMHPQIEVEVRTERSSHPQLERAHHLARAAVLDGKEFCPPAAA
jgi:ribonuclease HI